MEKRDEVLEGTKGEAGMKKETMREEKYLPLGSVILVTGSVKKILLIGRGAVSTQEGQTRYFDYVGVTYPEGLVGDTILYINHEDIAELIFRGYEDEDDKRMQDNLKEHVAGLFPGE